MHGGDGRLQLVRADLAPGQHGAEELGSLGDLRAIPLLPVLLGQRYQGPVRQRAGRPPRVGQQHQRQQARHLAVVRQQPVQPAGKPDGLLRQRGHGQRVSLAGRVTLVEDEVEDVQHGAQPFGPLRPGGQAEVEPGAGDGLLGPADALGHRRLRDPERRGDLRRGQAADRAQRQRDLAGRGQVRMTAAEQQGQRVVTVGGFGVGGGTEQFGRRGGHRDQFFAGSPRLLAAYLVRQPA